MEKVVSIRMHEETRDKLKIVAALKKQRMGDILEELVQEMYEELLQIKEERESVKVSQSDSVTPISRKSKKKRRGF